jgi:hypothetical protein
MSVLLGSDGEELADDQGVANVVDQCAEEEKDIPRNGVLTTIIGSIFREELAKDITDDIDNARHNAD